MVFSEETPPQLEVVAKDFADLLSFFIEWPGGLMVRHLTPDQNIPGSSPGWVNLLFLKSKRK